MHGPATATANISATGSGNTLVVTKSVATSTCAKRPATAFQPSSRELQKAMALPDTQEKNRIADYVPTNLDPKQSAAWLADNRERWTRVIQQNAIAPD